MKITISQIQKVLAAFAATLTIISQDGLFPPAVARILGIVGFVIALFFVELSKMGGSQQAPPPVPTNLIVEPKPAQGT